MKRLGRGYWSDALKAIGITPSDRGRERGLLLFEESDYKNALTDFLSHCQATGTPSSYDAFDNWVRNEERAGRHRPSAPAIRNFYRTWIAAKRHALTGDGALPRPPVTTVAASIARTGLHDASIARREAIELLSSIPAREVPNVLSSFIRDYMGEFEVRRREWVRAMILRDPTAVERRKAKDGLPKQQRHAMAKTPPDVAAALTDRYLDGLLSAEDGLKNVDGWLDDETQQQMNAISESDMAAARVMRELRNYFTHDSAEARHRLGDAFAKLATFDHRYQIEQALTRRVVTRLLLANDAARFKELSGSVLAAWRVMLAAEAVQPEQDSS